MATLTRRSSDAESQDDNEEDGDEDDGDVVIVVIVVMLMDRWRLTIMKEREPERKPKIQFYFAATLPLLVTSVAAQTSEWNQLKTPLNSGDATNRDNPNLLTQR